MKREDANHSTPERNFEEESKENLPDTSLLDETIKESLKNNYEFQDSVLHPDRPTVFKTKELNDLQE